MQNRITPDEIVAAARQLAKSEQGRVALKRLLALVEGNGVDLDLLNQRAFLTLLGGAWRGHSEQMREAVQQALQDPTA